MPSIAYIHTYIHTYMGGHHLTPIQCTMAFYVHTAYSLHLTSCFVHPPPVPDTNNIIMIKKAYLQSRVYPSMHAYRMAREGGREGGRGYCRVQTWDQHKICTQKLDKIIKWKEYLPLVALYHVSVFPD